MRPGRLLAAHPIRGDELRALRELRMTALVQRELGNYLGIWTVFFKNLFCSLAG
jgi:hypothetical protein